MKKILNRNKVNKTVKLKLIMHKIKNKMRSKLQ